MRVAPRYVFMNDPLRFGLELDYTRASWGTPNAYGKVENGVPSKYCAHSCGTLLYVLIVPAILYFLLCLV